MKLQKAIRRLQAFIRWRKPDPKDNFHESVQLGIEALKWRLLMEHDYGSWCGPPLPGETKE